MKNLAKTSGSFSALKTGPLNQTERHQSCFFGAVVKADSYMTKPLTRLLALIDLRQNV